MQTPENRLDRCLEVFRQEILRWNRQINLISRVETEDRLDGLFAQCVAGGEAVLSWLQAQNVVKGPGSSLLYYDLGSGGGLPGVIWNQLFSSVFPKTQSFLVEPREKRAWFLDRVSKIDSIFPYGTLNGRWGEVEASLCSENEAGESPLVVVISLKALHLDDKEVLSGLLVAQGELPHSFYVLIARYYPPEQELDASLCDKLRISPSGEPLEVEGSYYESQGPGLVPLLAKAGHGASLVFSSYRFKPTS